MWMMTVRLTECLGCRPKLAIHRKRRWRREVLVSYVQRHWQRLDNIESICNQLVLQGRPFGFVRCVKVDDERNVLQHTDDLHLHPANEQLLILIAAVLLTIACLWTSLIYETFSLEILKRVLTLEHSGEYYRLASRRSKLQARLAQGSISGADFGRLWQKMEILSVADSIAPPTAAAAPMTAPAPSQEAGKQIIHLAPTAIQLERVAESAAESAAEVDDIRLEDDSTSAGDHVAPAQSSSDTRV